MREGVSKIKFIRATGQYKMLEGIQCLYAVNHLNDKINLQNWYMIYSGNDSMDKDDAIFIRKQKYRKLLNKQYIYAINYMNKNVHAKNKCDLE